MRNTEGIKLDRKIKNEQLELVKKGRKYDKLAEENKALQTSHTDLVNALTEMVRLAKDGFATAGCLWQVQDAEKILKNEAENV